MKSESLCENQLTCSKEFVNDMQIIVSITYPESIKRRGKLGEVGEKVMRDSSPLLL